MVSIPSISVKPPRSIERINIEQNVSIWEVFSSSTHTSSIRAWNMKTGSFSFKFSRHELVFFMWLWKKNERWCCNQSEANLHDSYSMSASCGVFSIGFLSSSKGWKPSSFKVMPLAYVLTWAMNSICSELMLINWDRFKNVKTFSFKDFSTDPF